MPPPSPWRKVGQFLAKRRAIGELSGKCRQGEPCELSSIEAESALSTERDQSNATTDHNLDREAQCISGQKTIEYMNVVRSYACDASKSNLILGLNADLKVAESRHGYEIETSDLAGRSIRIFEWTWIRNKIIVDGGDTAYLIHDRSTCDYIRMNKEMESHSHEARRLQEEVDTGISDVVWNVSK